LEQELSNGDDNNLERLASQLMRVVSEIESAS
jgi:hypothetical protein